MFVVLCGFLTVVFSVIGLPIICCIYGTYTIVCHDDKHTFLENWSQYTKKWKLGSNKIYTFCTKFKLCKPRLFIYYSILLFTTLKLDKKEKAYTILN